MNETDKGVFLSYASEDASACGAPLALGCALSESMCGSIRAPCAVAMLGITTFGTGYATARSLFQSYQAIPRAGLRVISVSNETSPNSAVTSSHAARPLIVPVRIHQTSEARGGKPQTRSSRLSVSYCPRVRPRAPCSVFLRLSAGDEQGRGPGRQLRAATTPQAAPKNKSALRLGAHARIIVAAHEAPCRHPAREWICSSERPEVSSQRAAGVRALCPAHHPPTALGCSPIKPAWSHPRAIGSTEP